MKLKFYLWAVVIALAVACFCGSSSVCAQESPGFLDFSGAELCYGYDVRAHEDLSIAKAKFHVTQWQVGDVTIELTGDVLAVGPDPFNFSLSDTRIGGGASVNFTDSSKTFGLGLGVIFDHGQVDPVVYVRLYQKAF